MFQFRNGKLPAISVVSLTVKVDKRASNPRAVSVALVVYTACNLAGLVYLSGLSMSTKLFLKPFYARYTKKLTTNLKRYDSTTGYLQLRLIGQFPSYTR